MECYQFAIKTVLNNVAIFIEKNNKLLYYQNDKKLHELTDIECNPCYLFTLVIRIECDPCFARDR